MSGLPLVTCPACQTEMGLEALLGEANARGVVALMARMPGPPALRLGVLRYVGLFAPAKRQIGWDRVERLLGEVVEMMETGRIQREGRTWPAPLDYWSAALDALFAMPTLRRLLKGHGLLLEILFGMAQKADAKAESAALRTGRGETPVGTSGAHREFAPAPEQKKPRNPAVAAAALATAKSLLKGEKHGS